MIDGTASGAPMHYAPHALPILIAAVLSLILAIAAVSRRHAPGSRPFALLMAAVGVWSATYLLTQLGGDLADKVFWSKAGYVGAVTLPAAWLAFALRYTGWGRWIATPAAALLAVEPVVVLALAWTTEAHGLIWREVSLGAMGALAMLEVSHGPAYWLHLVYSYALVLFGVAVFARNFAREHWLYRRQAIAVLVAVLGPAAANLLFTLEALPVALDLTPAAAALGGLALAWGFFRSHLFDISPVARDLVIEGMSDAVIVLDGARRIVDVNPAARSLVGGAAGDIVGRRASEALAHLSLPLEQYLTPEDSRVEVLLSGAGRYFDLRVSLLDKRRGPVGGHLVVMRDVTDRKQAEKALRDSRDGLDRVVDARTAELQQANERLRVEQERLAVTLRSMRDGIIVSDTQGAVLLMNNAAERLTGWGDADARGEALHRVLPYSAGDVVAGGLAELADGHPHDVTPDRGAALLEVRGTSISDGPASSGWMWVLRDVTRERAEQRLIEQEGRMSALGQMAAGIAHDFNNLLGAMIAPVEILQSRSSTPDSAKEILSAVADAGWKGAQLVRQILDFGRQSNPHVETLDLAEALEQTWGLLRHTIPEDVTIVLDVRPGECQVMADPTQIQQVATNLAVNARDAMPDGGELGLRLRPLELQPGQPALAPGVGPGAWAVLEVSDTGVGMTAEVRERVFEPFFTTKDPGQGTGLGLAQVYGIVKQHGGHVAVES